jgi:hypothetical protein
MTSATGFIDRTARNAGKLPLPRIVATMLGVATAFFCFAMPQDVLDALFGSLGLAGPIGPVGRTLFLLFFTALAAGLGWMVVTVAGSPAIKREIDLSADRTPTQPRRRSFNPSDPSEAINAPPPTLLAVRRGDSHPDAPPRRPIFADHDLAPLGEGIPEADVEAADHISARTIIDVVPAAEPIVVPAEDKAAPTSDEAPAPPPEAETLPEAAKSEPEESRAPDLVAVPDAAPEADEPFDLTEALPIDPTPEPAPESPPAVAATADGSVGELMARLETGLERRGGDVPPAPSLDRSAGGSDVGPAPEEALRQALEALQRMAARQR